MVQRGANIETGRAVESLERGREEIVVGTSRSDLVAHHVIACAGLQADRVAAWAGTTTGRPRMVPSAATTTPSSRKRSNWSRASSTRSRPTRPLPRRAPHEAPGGGVIAGPNAVLATGARATGGSTCPSVTSRKLWAHAVSASSPAGTGGAPSRCGATGKGRLPCRPAQVRTRAQRRPPVLRAVRYPRAGPRADGSMVDDFQLGGSERVHVSTHPRRRRPRRWPSDASWQTRQWTFGL